jgi:hypothetical protein
MKEEGGTVSFCLVLQELTARARMNTDNLVSQHV